MPEVLVLTLLLATLTPLLAWHGLERSLVATTVTMAVPASTAATDLEGALQALRRAAPVAAVETAPPAAVEELWASLYGADAQAPILLDVRLWPTVTIDAAALDQLATTFLPEAVVEVHVGHLPPAWTTWPLLALWLAIGLTLGVRLRRGLRRFLAAERDALTLLVAFGGKPQRIEALVAKPAERRLTLASAGAALLGGALGLGLVATAYALPLASLASLPWLALPLAVLATASILPFAVRLLARRVLRRRLHLAMA
ncbi:MAG: hypothetical protein EA356_17220 [Geminicoccaceae bacterium]|nr:MAG: hypothetical protein EA356_17220 [Geminicoccaceae bacterium]